MAKIMMWCDHPGFATGMAYLGRQVNKILKKEHEIHYVGWHTTGQALNTKLKIENEWHEFKLYPVYDPTRTDYNAFNHWAKYIQPDWILALGDIQKMMLNNPVVQFNKGIAIDLIDKLIVYLDIDISPLVSWMPFLPRYEHIIVPTQWAGREMNRIGVPYDTIIPHPIDLSIWHMISPARRRDIKKEHGLPEDSVIIGGIGNNQDRKKWNLWIKIFAMAKRLIEKEYHRPVWGYLHVPTPQVEPTSFYDLQVELERYGLQNSVTLFGDPYGASGYNLSHTIRIKQEGMHNVYGLCDILLHIAASGAWELPISEAQACGTLAIANDYAGMSDSCLPDLKVRVTRFETNETGADWAIADEIGFLQKIELCIKERESLVKKQYQHVKQFSTDKVAPQWLNYFRNLDISGLPEQWEEQLEVLYNGD